MFDRTCAPHQLHMGDCPDCGKKRYLTRREAKRAARALHPNEPLRPYTCGPYWHVGNTAPWRKHGEAAR